MDKQIRQLEQILKAQLDASEQLQAMFERKREALRSADHRQVSHLCELENEKVQLLSELEKRRLGLIGELTAAFEPNAKTPMRLTDIAERFRDPVRGRLLVLREQLRAKMEQVREQTAVTRQATESLAKHMQGLVQTVTTACSGSAAYNRTGGMPQKALAIRTINTTA